VPAPEVRPRWVVVAAWAAGGCLLALVALSVAIHHVGRVLRVDVRVLDLVDRLRAHGRWLVQVLGVLTWSGDFLFASVGLLAVCMVVTRRRRSRAPLWLGLSAVGLLLGTVGTGKAVIARSRIPFSVGSFGDGGTSYPSGHATTAVVVGGCLVLLAAPVLSRTGLRWAWAGMVAYAGLIGASRLYLRMHWFTDVLAGWLLGAVIVCVLAIVFVRAPAVVTRAVQPDPVAAGQAPAPR